MSITNVCARASLTFGCYCGWLKAVTRITCTVLAWHTLVLTMNTFYLYYSTQVFYSNTPVYDSKEATRAWVLYHLYARCCLASTNVSVFVCVRVCWCAVSRFIDFNVRHNDTKCIHNIVGIFCTVIQRSEHIGRLRRWRHSNVIWSPPSSSALSSSYNVYAVSENLVRS